MLGNRKRLGAYPKIKKFYERVRKGVYFRISNQILENDPDLAGEILKDRVLTLDHHPTWVRNPVIEIGDDIDSFVKNLKSVVIYYSYPKYGNGKR